MDTPTLIFLGIIFLPVFLALAMHRSKIVRTHLHQSGVAASYWGVYEGAQQPTLNATSKPGTVALPTRIPLPDDGHEKNERDFAIHFPEIMS